MKLKIALVSIITLSVILTGCSKSLNQETNKFSIPKTVTVNVIFRAFKENPQDISGSSAGQPPLSGVTILLIGADGKVIDKLFTNDQGEAQKNITVPIDNKYIEKTANDLKPRGTVTAIAFKNGFRQTVLFEVPVSDASAAQPFYMAPIVPGERNEPEVQLGNNHHLEIISLVEKYAAYANNNN